MQCDGREFEWTLGDGDGQGGLVCCDSWGCKESDITEWLNWTEEISSRKLEMPREHFMQRWAWKLGTMKDRNSKDLTEAEEIKKRWLEYREELYKKDLNDPDHHNGVITHLEPDILECKVKWALGSSTINKASGGDRIPAELFQILKDGAVKVLHSICQQIWNTQQWPQDWKRSVFIPIPKKGNA